MNAHAAPGRRFGGKTADERRGERRKQLIRAAVQVYGERGYRSATVKLVCDAAGLTERYFYESFENSEDLLCVCFQDGADRLLKEVRAAGAKQGGLPLDRVRAGVLVYLASLRARPRMARVFLIEISSVSVRADLLVTENLDRFGALLVDMLWEGSAAPDCDRLLVRGVIGGGLHVAQAWISGGYAAPMEDVASTILQLYGLSGPSTL